LPGVERSLAGPCLTADGKLLVLSIPSPGITVAISGPWQDHLG
jgi:hypothetical protein